MNHTEEVAQTNNRMALRTAILAVSDINPESLNSELEKVLRLAKSLEEVTLEESEFISLIMLFNHTLSSTLALRIFKVLQSVLLTETQIMSFFDWNNRIDSPENIHKCINWSFLDKTVGMKRHYVMFLKRSLRSYRMIIPDVVRTFLLLLDDEDIIIRTRSYRELMRILKQEYHGWGRAQRREFRKRVAYFGPERLSILKAEYLGLRAKAREVRIEITPINDMFKIYVRLGHKIRKKPITISITGKQTQSFTGHRKHTTIYCKLPHPPKCIVYHNQTILAQKD
ncbi:hypothetical protein NEDG_00956 [Nematocida displodere]|uniref:Uncharacterized protein n=1 Tax=Nematocida displodere TaxID=1805483 RepID=A0A177EA59_9MICR|nr:hypothetical protein NEDG_00956 [Nematocida displodere]